MRPQSSYSATTEISVKILRWKWCEKTLWSWKKIMRNSNTGHFLHTTSETFLLSHSVILGWWQAMEHRRNFCKTKGKYQQQIGEVGLESTIISSIDYKHESIG